MVFIGVDVLVFVSRSVAESARAYLNVDELFDKVVKKFDIFGGKNEVKKIECKTYNLLRLLNMMVATRSNQNCGVTSRF